MKKRNLKKVLILSTLAATLFALPVVHAHNTDVYSGNWPSSVATNLAVAYGTSASTWSALIQQSAERWNGIDPNVAITSIYHNPEVDNETFPSRINLFATDLGSTGDWALALNFKYSVLWGYTGDWDAEWKVGRIRLNNNTDSTTKRGFSFYDTDLKRKIITHEIGHTLGLKHPADTSETAIMKQGDNLYYTIQTHDKDVLKSKY
ncbi:M57 family metalloprotease [Paenibacillus sp. LHD-117]|uniref:M57 family metalloprotease n=1 Tax=Paenibacillus sp. LHD-117 TaxID=3071412 RepID=UPI0027E16A57|nr:M57 family metalloprotease [Paenibacillus sp. LHD-117]MDQ6418833.1 M57 family metalloprotease [Paenibacillus sp. LHD-117]